MTKKISDTKRTKVNSDIVNISIDGDKILKQTLIHLKEITGEKTFSKAIVKAVKEYGYLKNKSETLELQLAKAEETINMLKNLIKNKEQN